MHLTLLELLRCPFCGAALNVVNESPSVIQGDRMESGVLGCECCAYPVVAGIPVLIADDRTRTAMHQLEAGDARQALLTLLGLEGARAAAFTALLEQPERMTYRSAVDVLSPDPEGTYFLYRFSDPTFRLAEGVLDALGQAGLTGRAIDLCGGSGHLTRVLTGQASGREVVLADIFYWKLWLARTFTAPACAPVCCDGNHPLPFARESFEVAVLSDAFPYIWHKRLLANEMVRLVGLRGTIAMPHLHSSLGWNYSAGMTLTPASYRALFEGMTPRLFPDTALFGAVVDEAAIDLGADVSVEALGDANSFTLVASSRPEVFRRVALTPPGDVRGELRVNPLYTVTVAGAESTLTLAFPNEDYESEFQDCRRYLPDTITIPGDARGPLVRGTLGAREAELRRRRIVVDVPPRYL